MPENENEEEETLEEESEEANEEETLEEESEEANEEETLEEESEEVDEEKDEKELSQTEIDAVPLILCSEDLEPMEIEGTDEKEVEERGFLFTTNTEQHMHLKYKCPECGKHFFYDMEAQRQGCFIATAAYGTPLAKEINVLRKFRDTYLERRKWGKKLVSIYYTLSPPIAKIIEKSERLKKLTRTCLLPLVDFFKENKEDPE